MVRTSLTVPFEPTGMPKPQVDRPKFAPSTNPQYQCGFRAIREETRDRYRDALLRPRSTAYSIENTGTPGETTPFREVPKVTPSAWFSDSVIRASVSRAAADIGRVPGPDVPRTEVNAKEPQKVTPWKNYLAESKSLIGNIARHSVTPCGSRSEPSFCFICRALTNVSAMACRARSPQPRRLILRSLSSPDSCPFRRAFPPRRNLTFLLCANRTFSLCTDGFFWRVVLPPLFPYDLPWHRPRSFISRAPGRVSAMAGKGSK
jgi:hypothetical protein